MEQIILLSVFIKLVYLFEANSKRIGEFTELEKTETQH